VGRTANQLIWSVWEPVIFALFLIAGSVWCTICPLSTAGRWAQRLGTLGRPPPGWLKRHGVWLAVVGFFAIVWAERAFDMAVAPAASALLLTALLGASVVLCLIYAREVWCRYVCPLGALAKALAPAAPLELGARPGLCTSSCTTHDCFKGAPPIPGCTVFHHPLDAAESHQCKLCLDCLKSCPHGSTGLFLRPPLSGVWRLGAAGAALAPFAVAVFLLAPVFLAARNDPGLDRPLPLLAAGAGAIGAAALLWWALPRLLGAARGRRPEAAADAAVPARVAFGLLVLGWGPLMAYQVANVSGLEHLTLSGAPGSVWARVLPESGVSGTLIAQLAMVSCAVAAAAVILIGVLAASRRQARGVPAVGWCAVAAIVVVYTAATLFVLL
jgi:polyferredoxin